MIDITTIKVGDRVYYKPNYNQLLPQNGIVAQIDGLDFCNVKHIKVKYEFSEQALLTNINDLYLGWND